MSSIPLTSCKCYLLTPPYGTTFEGGSANVGTVFRLLLQPDILAPTLALQIQGERVLLSLTGTLSNDFTVQYSTNLLDTNWIDLLSVTNLSSNSYRFFDPNGVVPAARFYRAVELW